ncbi:putative cytidylate kinase [Treponema primitia ZAS-2]|uniref:Cytidylate kinase n=1 Tax=Treponema primitia (strain ATCC BAA-887 / DSM 12427 / ZAS-2) TaxID=545694 RepID=F5YHG8_TREPZ|nr:AAA family ATPase [Treponema primitia]AEF85016.1 putative cytidylate kinase [Treponema primitia ZAS-2]
MKKDIRIAISGKSGCGNTTISRMVSDTLGLRFINFTFRSLAEEKGMSLKEVLDQAAKDDSWDREVDSRQLSLARGEGGCVLGSRLAIWMLKEADLMVYLKAKPETRASRIVKREGGSIESVAAFTAERDRQDRERYIRIYNIDNDDYSFADLIIDTDTVDPRTIADLIVSKVTEKLS